MLRNNSFLEQNTQRNVQYYKLDSELLQIDSIGRKDEKAERNVLDNMGGLALGGVDTDHGDFSRPDRALCNGPPVVTRWRLRASRGRHSSWCPVGTVYENRTLKVS